MHGQGLMIPLHGEMTMGVSGVRIVLSQKGCLTEDMTPVRCMQLTTGCASVSFLNGMAPAFHGTILVQNPGHKQNVTLEFQERSAWQMLTSNKGVKDGARFPSQSLLGSSIAGV